MKKRKIFKKISLAGLAACMFCLPILAGCAPAEMLPEKPTQGQNFDLGLNPETDPIVYTTQSGLQIKKSDGKYSSTTTVATNTGYTVTQDLTSFYYFTMGKFSGTIYTAKTQTDTYTVTNEPVNWLIIGRGEMAVADSTPAGSAIQGDAGKQEIAMGSSIYENLNLSAIPENSEIPKGCFLVLSEKLLGQMYFNSSDAINYTFSTDSSSNIGYNCIRGNGNYGTRYRYKGDVNTGSYSKQTWNNKTDGSLYTYINNLFSKSISGVILKNSLGLSDKQANLIVPQKLYTKYQDTIETFETDGGTYYTMFPLAWQDNGGNFNRKDYLKTNEKNVAVLIGSQNLVYQYAMRDSYNSQSGDTYNCVTQVHGGLNSGNFVNFTSGVRPAMVMKLS